jgi:hypothetical protein
LEEMAAELYVSRPFTSSAIITQYQLSTGADCDASISAARGLEGTRCPVVSCPIHSTPQRPQRKVQ